MNGNGRGFVAGGPPVVPLIAPRQEVQLRHVMQDGPSAHPVLVPAMLPMGDGAHGIVTFGGLTKLEALAGQIAGQLYGMSHDSLPNFSSEVCDIAQAILDECKRRQSPEPAKT